MRGPFSDTLLDAGAGDVVDAAGGPLGVVKAGVFLVAGTVVLVGLLVGTEALLGAVLGSSWLGTALWVGSVGLATIGGFLAVLRFMTWRRRRG